jgi:hypothetical protein
MRFIAFQNWWNLSFPLQGTFIGHPACRMVGAGGNCSSIYAGVSGPRSGLIGSAVAREIAALTAGVTKDETAPAAPLASNQALRSGPVGASICP